MTSSKLHTTIIFTVAFALAALGIFYLTTRTAASPSLVVDGTSSLGTAYTNGRRIIRTTNGGNGKRTFVLAFNGTNGTLYYSDNPEASSPDWSNVVINYTGGTLTASDMVWDETNNVIYLCYAARSVSAANNRDIMYRRISALNTTPSAGAEQIVFDGSAVGTTYQGCNIEIAGDSSTNKVFLFGNSGTAGSANEAVVVQTGTLNSDTPSWSGSYTVKSWTAAADSGTYGVTRMNTNKLVLFYYNGSSFMATRHDDSASGTASSGWDALDGTDNSQTTISSDNPVGSSVSMGSTVGSFTADIVWFAWLDSTQEINTQSWQSSSLGTEQIAELTGSSSPGPSLTTDGTLLYLSYRNQGDTTQVVFQNRLLNDGVNPWSGVETVIDDTNENTQFVTAAKKLYQGHLDVLSTTNTSFYVRHAGSYLISGNAYQESVGAPYEGTTAWSGCDNATLNVAVVVAGGTKVNTWCDDSTGAFNFVLAQPAAADSDITVFLDTAGGAKAALFTHNNDTITDIIGLSLYVNRVSLRSESSSSLTNADINSYDQSNDGDIPIASDGTAVTADSGTKILVLSGDTYAPGGSVTASKLHLKGTYTGASETLTLSGSGSSSSCDDTVSNLRPLCIDGGTYTPSSNSTQFTGTSASLIQNATYNTLGLKPGANAVTHTLMGGTFTVGGALTFGNGTNTDAVVTAATNSTTLTANSSLTIAANTTFVANSSNTTTVLGNWTNSGGFTHSSGTVSLAGADSSTQSLSGNTTFNHLIASTAGNSAGRTIQFAGSSSTTVAGTWTVTGFSGKVITLQSSDTNNWSISPTAASVDYTTVSRSDSSLAICATHSTDGNNNNANWTFTAGAACASPTPSFQIEGLTLQGLSLN